MSWFLDIMNKGGPMYVSMALITWLVGQMSPASMLAAGLCCWGVYWLGRAVQRLWAMWHLANVVEDR